MKISINYAKLITAALVITTLSGFFALATFLTGCIDDTEKLPKVVAAFTYKVNEDTGTVQFFNVSERATKFLWAFGDNTTSTEKEPVKTYAAGTYEVTLKAFNNAGASNETKATVTVVIKDKVSLPITFDGINVDYNVTTFTGASFAIVNNPSLSGTNNKTTKVGSITNSGAQFEGIFLNVAVPIDLATKKTIAMNVRSTKPVNVLLKLEEGTSGAVEVSASHGGTGWENLVFNFTSSAKYSRITLFVGGATVTTGTFFVDDIEQKVTETPCTPDATQGLTATDLNITFKTDPGTAIGSFDAVYTYANNPDIKNAVNTSCKVGKIERNGGALFANNQIVLNSKLDFTTHSGFKLKVFSAATGYSVLVKLEDKLNNSINTEVSKTTTVGTNQWEELTFPFAGSQSGKYDKIILFFQLNTNTTATYYIDDFAFYGTGSGPTKPTTGAPTPPARAAGDVISIYGGTYTNLAGINYNPDWGQSGLASVNPSFNPGDGNLALAYPNFNYQGTDLASNVDASSMQFLHVDIWVAPGTDRQVKVSPINMGTGAGEFLAVVPLTPGSWKSVDLPISSFTGMTWNAVKQLKFDGQFNGNGTANTTPFDIYLDNIYFYKAGAPPTAPTTSAPVPPARAAGDVISIYGGTYTNLAGIDYAPNWGQNPPVVVNTSFNPGNGNLALAYTNLTYQGTQLASNVDASSMQFLHVDIWVASGTNRQVRVSPINDSAPTEVQVNVPLTPGAWNSVDIPKSSFTGMTWNSVKQMIFNGQFNGDGTANTTPFNIYLDNIYFYKSSGGGGGTNLITNGGFESGDAGWLLFNNNGATSISSTENNGGTKSAKIESGKFDNPGIKQERFGAGTVLANTQYEVKFDVKQQALADGAIVNAFVFSETSNANPAVQHPLTPITLSQGNWSSNTLTFTTASDVSGGISLLIEVVCGGADSCNGVVFIDNVSITKK